MAIMSSPYHVGIVVTDIEREMARLTSILGVTWGQVVDRQLTMETPAGVVTSDCQFNYSLTGPPHLELIQHTPDGPWNTTGLHHLGFWTDSLQGGCELLVSNGCERESVTIDDTGAWVGGLHVLTPDGVRIEVVNIETSGPRLARYQRDGAWS